MANEKKGKTLTDEQIETGKDEGGSSRRSMLALMGVGAATGALAATGCAPRLLVPGGGVVVRGGYTDGDRGQCGYTDPAGNGRGVTCAGQPVVVQRTGYTDGDRGQCGYTDAAGNGRGQTCGGVVVQQPASGCSDSDPTDGAGRGVRCGGGWGGNYHDSPGRGRRCYGCTDSD
jgi:hypothetical protein